MLRILIADDHDGVRSALKSILLDEFPDVILEESEDARMLIEKASNDHWDIVVSDLIMPHGGGFAALKHLRESKPSLPIIIFSTYPAEQYASRVMEAGAAAFVGKDDLSEVLPDKIREVLSGV